MVDVRNALMHADGSLSGTYPEVIGRGLQLSRDVSLNSVPHQIGSRPLIDGPPNST